MKAVLSFACLVAAACANPLYVEDFTGDWESRWVQSKHKSDYGKFDLSAGKFPADAEASKGLHTAQDARFYAISSRLPSKIDGTAGDGITVVQFEVKHEQNIDCGGGYIKVLPEFDLSTFNGDTPYYVMFGPDICGATRKVQLIFNYNGENLLWKKTLSAESDDLTHLYTLVLDYPNQKYEVHVDGVKKESGNLEDDWSFLKPKEIDDPSDRKPSDWVDDAQMDDPTDVKPEGYDDIPESISDPEASRPEDWDEEEDGAWEAPTIPNPEFKGIWKPKRIPNPEYKGVWAAKRIPNPAYVEDKHLAKYTDIAAVGFDLWQVKSGTIFDNIIITNNLKDAQDYAAKTFTVNKDLEKKAKDAIDEAAKKAAEASAAAAKTDDAAADDDEEL
jgi:calreticulin